MVFSSTIFIFAFIPIVFTTYYITPAKFKNLVLLIASLFFYAWGEFRYFPLIILLTTVNYFLALLMDRHRGKKSLHRFWFVLSLIANLGALVVFKYSNFIVSNINIVFKLSIPLPNIPFPLGISFFTFQVMAYCIDVYKGSCNADKNFIDYAVALTMFPQLVAGPIVRYTDIQAEVKQRRITLENVQAGTFTLIMGLGSKVLIADNIGALWTEIGIIGYENISTPLAWIGLIGYALQIYFDFSGYSLMALGMGKMLGFNFPQNFNYPYVAKSITGFWRRWHMTLSSWFRDYVYIPLGGSRVNPARQYINLFVVWALTGIWHGDSWNFLLWGLFFFIFLCLEKTLLLEKLETSKVIGHIYLIFLVLISWALFAISDFDQLGLFLKKLFVWRSGWDWIYYLKNYAAIGVIGIIFSTPLLKKLSTKLGKAKLPLFTIFAAIVLFASIAYMVDSTFSPFLYFRF